MDADRRSSWCYHGVFHCKLYARFAYLIKKWAAMYTMILAGIRASLSLFNGAWRHVMRSPTGWHDRTPVSSSPSAATRSN